MKNTLLILSLCILFISCKKDKKTIILSKASSNYVEWLKSEEFHIIDAYTIKNTDSILKLADGIVLTGGEDINPIMYNDSSNLELCETINYKRDTLEKKIFDFAFRHKIPLVGICRGMQMMNVVTGGSLYGDIATEIGEKVIHRNNGEVSHEVIVINKNNNIFPINKDTFMVNSWHHQGLKNISDILNVIAISKDSLAEAVEVDKNFHPFMIAVQFHPERLEKENGIHNKIKESFFNAIKEK